MKTLLAIVTVSLIALHGSARATPITQKSDQYTYGGFYAAPSLGLTQPGYASPDVYSTSSGWQAPLIGGGAWEQQGQLTPDGMRRWAEMVGAAFTTQAPTSQQMLIKGYACVHYTDELRAAGIVCEKND